MSSAAPPRLTWSLVVATYARHEMLARSVAVAVRQDRPPEAVVVVDGSPDWEAGRARVGAALEAAGYAGPFVYEPAATLGLCAQRNQAIARATSDVLFLLDDDSFLLPGAAERIMRVYESDPEGAILGVAPVHADEPPADAALPPPEAGDGSARGRLRDRLVRLTWRGTGYFLPYDAAFPEHPVPPAARALGARPVRVFDGFRMTFRRSLFERLRFDEMLQRYAVSEDQDFSYRASRLGALVEVPGAGVHHAAASGGRLSRRTVVTLRWANRVALRTVHGSGRGRVLARLAAAFPYHLAVDVLQDVVDGDVRFQRARGTLRAIPLCVRLALMRPERVRARYPRLQAEVLRRDAAPGRARASPG